MIHIENLVKRYGDLIALDHLNLDIKEGEIFGLLGPNGSGKSTAIGCMLALLKYDKGTIQIFGKNMTPDSYDIKKEIGVVMQNVAVFHQMSVRENVDYFCGLYVTDKQKRKKLVDEALDFVGLTEYSKKRPGKLSGCESLPLLQIQDTFVATKQYLENQHRLFPLEPLSHTATFMLLDEQNITRQSVNIMLHDHQLQLGHILEVSSMDLLIQFAQVGLGIACVIKEFVQKELDEGTLVEVPLGLVFPSREIGFVCRSGTKAQELVTSSQSLFI